MRTKLAQGTANALNAPNTYTTLSHWVIFKIAFSQRVITLNSNTTVVHALSNLVPLFLLFTLFTCHLTYASTIHLPLPILFPLLPLFTLLTVHLPHSSTIYWVIFLPLLSFTYQYLHLPMYLVDTMYHSLPH